MPWGCMPMMQVRGRFVLQNKALLPNILTFQLADALHNTLIVSFLDPALALAGVLLLCFFTKCAQSLLGWEVRIARSILLWHTPEHEIILLFKKKSLKTNSQYAPKKNTENYNPARILKVSF